MSWTRIFIYRYEQFRRKTYAQLEGWNRGTNRAISRQFLFMPGALAKEVLVEG